MYPTGITASFTGQTLNATIASLAPDEYVTILFTVTVNAPIGAIIINTAVVEVLNRDVRAEASVATTVVAGGENNNGPGNGDDRTSPDPGLWFGNRIPPTIGTANPQQPGVEAPITEQQATVSEATQPAVYGVESEELPEVVAVEAYEPDYIPSATGARVNPQTRDNRTMRGLVLSALGLVAALLAVAKRRRAVS